MQDPVIVPLKILKEKSGISKIAFHAKQPWVFSATCDGALTLWT